MTVTHIIFLALWPREMGTETKKNLLDQAERNTGIDMHSIKITRNLNIHTHTDLMKDITKTGILNTYLEVGTNRLQKSNG